MFWIPNKLLEIFWVLALIGVISYSIYTKWYDSLSSGEFWVLLFVLLVQIKHIIPESIKSYIIYTCNKIFSGKFFDVKLDYTIRFSSEIKENNWIYLLLEDKLRWETKTFIKSADGLFLFGEWMKIRYQNDIEDNEQYLHISIFNNQYTISSLEKDLHYYQRILWIIKDSIQVKDQSISSSIEVNSFYTPEYLLKRYSKWYDQLEVKIEDHILIKRNSDHEVLRIESWWNIDDFTDALKKYIKLAL